MKSPRKFSAASAALVFGALVSGTTALTPVATAQAVDVDALAALLPDGVVATWSNVSYDEGTDTTTIGELKITAEGEEDIGMVFGEISLTGLDEDLLNDRIAGTNFDASGTLFDRVSAKETAFFGAEVLSNEFNNAYLNAIEDVTVDALEGNEEAEQALEDAFAGQQDSITKLDFRIAEMTMENVKFLPFVPATPRALSDTLDDVDVDEDVDEGFAFIQSYFAYNRAFGADTAKMSGLVYELEMVTEDQPLSMAFEIDEYTLTDWQGGNVGESTMSGLRYDLVGPVDEDDEDLPFDKIEMSGEIGSYKITGLKLDRALEWLAKGELPPETETDLLSLGTWSVENEKYTLFGAPFYSLGSSTIDLSGFHWLVPTKMDISYSDVRYHIGDLFDTILAADPDLFEDDEEAAQVQAVMTALEASGLTTPTFDMDMKWRWDAEGGPLNLGIGFDMADFGKLTLNMDGSIADFASLYAAFAAGEDGEIDPQALLAATSNLSNFTLEMSDYGGIDRLLGAVIEVAKAMPEDSEMAPLAAFEPQGLKGMMVGLMTLGSADIVAGFPEAADYIAALAGYINQGGTIRVALDPDEPLGIETAAQLQTAEGPSEIVDLISLTVEHTAPTAE